MSLALAQSAPQLDDSWRSWIAENLMLGGHPAELANVLQARGFSLAHASAEIEQALRSPYLQGARRLKNRLAKHDWVLDIYRKLNRLQDRSIPRRARLSGEQFLHEFYSRNQPVIITGMMNDWPALKKWDLDYFRAGFAAREVEVQFGRNQDQHYELNSIAHKKTMRFGDYLDLIRDSGQTNDFYMTANNDSKNSQALHELWRDIRPLPQYLRESANQRGFFWFGPQGTLTPFHHDLTNNFMAQVMGSKRVHIMAACEVAHLYNQRHCFTEVDGMQIDYQRFPGMREVQISQCELHPGEILFLPVGCWHMVEGLSTSVTMAFTNFIWDNDFFSNYPTEHDF